MEEDYQQYFEKAYEFLTLYGLKIIAAIIIFVIGKWIAKKVKKGVAALLTKGDVDTTLVNFLSNIAYYVLLIFVVIAALNKLGVQTASVIAIFGAAGLAVGLALQGSLSNFAAGVMLILFRPFKAGDVIEAAGSIGKVESISIFNTILRPADNRRFIIPNSKVLGDTIINITDVDFRRIDMVFGVSYDDDLSKAKEILMKLVKEHPKVLKDKEPIVKVLELGDSSVNIVCRPFCKPEDYWDILFDITEQGKVELEKAGLSIPYPQRDVHMIPAAQGVS